jgi:hypothetical protein
MSILLLLPLLTGGGGFSQMFNNDPFSLQKPCDMKKPCDMDHCNPYMPKCPLCPSLSSSNLYLHHEAGAYLPIPISTFILLSVSTLSDQGVVKTIFHPPTSIS